MRLAEAFAHLGDGATLTFAGDGPLRARLEGRHARAASSGACRTHESPRLLADSHVLCQPSLIEPLGQALLEAMACGRSVVATRIGGPPEFVPPDAGVLVDPLDVDALAAGCARAAAALHGRTRPRARPRPRTTCGAQAERIEAILSRAAAGRRA